MNRITVFFMFIFSIVMTSCSTSKQLKTLKFEKSILEERVDELIDENAELSEDLKEFEGVLEAAREDKEDCEMRYEVVNAAYKDFRSKSRKLKKEIEAAFPNKLNEPNFSIVEEDGRLIISLPNKILYARGKAEFDGKALEVIQKLALIFKANPGLQILVEGHTDLDPINTAKFKDNWDLSLGRAVIVTRQLEKYGVHPSRLTAAGRGGFSPKSTLDTPEAKAINRRTEIIIRPKISTFLKAFEEVK